MYRPTDRISRILAVALIALTAALIGAVAWQRAGRARRPHVEPDRRLYPMRGIDLSAHNGAVDFDAVASDGIAFVYLKASEGLSFRDSSFRRNHAAARAAGLAVGAYHFFRFDCDGRRQAINMLSAVDSCRLDLPLAIDVEEWNNAAGFTTEIVSSRLHAMVDYLRAHGRRVAVYTNKNGFWRFVHSNFNASDPTDSIGVWICSFTSPPMPGDSWTFWQHSHQGRVKGIRGKVDLNTFRGDSSSWRLMLEGGSDRTAAQ